MWAYACGGVAVGFVCVLCVRCVLFGVTLVLCGAFVGPLRVLSVCVTCAYLPASVLCVSSVCMFSVCVLCVCVFYPSVSVCAHCVKYICVFSLCVLSRAVMYPRVHYIYVFYLCVFSLCATCASYIVVCDLSVGYVSECYRRV